jgi:hypothetical protein
MSMGDFPKLPAGAIQFGKRFCPALEGARLDPTGTVRYGIGGQDAQ